MAESVSGGERRRVFSAEFKLEAVRRMEERRAGGVNLTQIGRELGVRPDQLRKWRRQHDQRANRGSARTGSQPGSQSRDHTKDELSRASMARSSQRKAASRSPRLA
jgi:transposase-like protein